MSDADLVRGFEALLERVIRKQLPSTSHDLWLDQEQSVLGRNIHTKACKRLIRKGSPDAYYDSANGRWLLRSTAVDQEIQRRNRALAEKLPETMPPPAPAAVTPLPALVKTRAPIPEEPEDETGIYERALSRLRGAR